MPAPPSTNAGNRSQKYCPSTGSRASDATETADSEQPGGQRRPDADAADDDLREVRDDDDGQREADEGHAALDGGVVEDVLQVQREQEELRERDRADDRHRRVRGRERAEPEDPQRQERRLASELDRDEREHERRGAGEQPERRRRAPPSLVARVSA